MCSVRGYSDATLANIFAFCEINDFPGISLVCKKFNEVLQNNFYEIKSLKELNITHQQGRAKEILSSIIWKEQFTNANSEQKIKDLIACPPFSSLKSPIQQNGFFIKAHQHTLLKEILMVLKPSYKLVTYSLNQLWDEADVAEIIKKLDPSLPVPEKVIKEWESHASLSPFINLFNSALSKFKSDLGRHSGY